MNLVLKLARAASVVLLFAIGVAFAAFRFGFAVVDRVLAAVYRRRIARESEPVAG